MLELFEQVVENWISINDPAEKQILMKHAKLGLFKTKFYIGYSICTVIFFSQVIMFPVIQDFIVPLNETRQRILIIKTQFLVDPYEYYFESLSMYSILFTVQCIITITMHTTYAVIVQQGLGMFDITKYRVGIAMKEIDISFGFDYSVIISSIKLHQKCLEIINKINSSYNSLFFGVIVYIVIFITSSALPILENLDNILDSIRLTVIMIGGAAYLFYLSWPGQLVQDQNSELFQVIYACNWYHAPKKAKTLVIIMMMRCMTPCTITAARFYTMNFENFGTVLKTAMSYFMVLASMSTLDD